MGGIIGGVGLLLAVVAVVVYILRRKISQRAVVFNCDLMSESPDPSPSVPSSRSPGPHTPGHSAAGNNSIIPFFPSARKISIYGSNFTAVGRDQNESAAPIGRESSSWVAQDWMSTSLSSEETPLFVLFQDTSVSWTWSQVSSHTIVLVLLQSSVSFTYCTTCQFWYYSYISQQCSLLRTALALNTP